MARGEGMSSFCFQHLWHSWRCSAVGLQVVLHRPVVNSYQLWQGETNGEKPSVVPLVARLTFVPNASY